MKTLKLLTTMAILGLAILPLTGCGEDGVTGPKVTGGSYDVTVTLDEFYVVGDCDELLGGKGEFSYTVSVRVAGGGWDEVAKKSLSGDKGKGYAIDKNKTMTLDAADPKSIEIKFWAKETDDPLIGDPKADDRMNGRDKIAVHAYRGNGDWDLGAHSITLGNEDGCKVRLDYTLQAVKVAS
jgi:hypothetical protein